MKVACIQSSAGENYKKNFKQIIRLIYQSIKNKADLIVTPETTSLITSNKKILYNNTYRMNDDPLIKNVQMQLANNPDLTFAQSLGFGTPDEFMNQTEALKALGPRASESLKVLNPEKYYGKIEEGGFGFKPTTQAELEALAKMDIGTNVKAGNRGLVDAIAAARFQLRQGKSDDRQQAGIPSVVPPPVTPPGAPQPPIVPFPQPPIAGLPTFPGLVQGAPQFNYGAFPQFNLSTYAQQGIANPNLAAFYQNLGRIA